jgi:hypothetical protein
VASRHHRIIRKIDAELRHVNERRPIAYGEPYDGLPSLLSVECSARGVSGLGPQHLSLDRHLLLPDFNKPGAKAWPPFELPLGVLLADNLWRQA